METLLQDIRVTLRSFRRSPGFPLTAIATLALGIGATTAIFTTLSAVLLNPLPYPKPENLYSVRTALTDGRVTSGLLSGSEIYRLNDPKLAIERAAGVQTFDLTLLGTDDRPSHVQASAVTEGFFELFGLPMTKGGFTRDDFTPITPPAPNTQPPPPPPATVVISHQLWRDNYNSDPNVVGKAIRFAEFSGTIVGVAPRDLDIPRADVILSQRLPSNDLNHSQEAFFRLRDGATIDRAQREMAVVMRGIGEEYPAAAKNRIYVDKPLVESIVGDLGPILVIVMAATGLLLLLACVNVANLLLARGAARAREMAVRAALGAGWGRLAGQLLTESMVLATLGTIFGVALGAIGLRGLLAIGASKLPRLDAVQFDMRVFLFALVVMVVVGAIIGLAPTVRLMRSDMKTLMNDGSRSASAGRGTTRWLMAMTVTEVALAIMLVAGAGWLVRGFSNLRNTDAGFVADGRMIFDVALLGERFQTPEPVYAAFTELVAAVKTVPGVTGAGLISHYPMRPRLESSLLAQFHGEPFDAQNPPGTRQRFASPGLFAAMGTKIIKGRDFEAGDLPNTAQVAIVNKVFVDRYLKGRDPIGVQFSAGYPAPNPENEVTIVGVINDIRQKSLGETAEPAYYQPTSQLAINRVTAVVNVSNADIGAVQRGIREEMRKLHPAMAVDFELATDLLDATLRRQKLGMTLMLVFGGIAIVLAAVGIYGVVSYAGSLRREEMATRLALGATPQSVFLLVMKQGALLGVAGAAIGIGLAFLSGKIISSKVYEIRASDPIILASATVLITLITCVATLMPAFRSARLSPSSALRSE